MNIKYMYNGTSLNKNSDFDTELRNDTKVMQNKTNADNAIVIHETRTMQKAIINETNAYFLKVLQSFFSEIMSAHV